MRRALASTSLLVALPLWWGCASTATPRPEAPRPSGAEGEDDPFEAEPKEVELAWVDVTPAAAPTGTPEGPRELHLTEAVGMALAENPDIHVAAARIARAEANLEETRAAWRPDLGLEFGYLRADAPSMFLFKTIDAGRYVPGTDFNDPGAFSNWEAGINLQYNIYNGGRDQLQKQIAEDGVELERLQQAVVRNALAAAVIDAWYTVLGAEEQILTAQASVATTRSQVDEARVRFEEGRSLRSDLLSLQVRQAEAEEMVIRAENGRQLALATLAQLLGLDADVELTLMATRLDVAELPESFDESLEAAVARRPELEQARRSVMMAERQVDQARSGILPTADLFARGWYDSPDIDFDGSRENWALGVALNWNFYDGGRRGAGVDRSEARLDEMRRSDRKAMLAVQLDVKSAWVRLDDARQRLEVAGSAVGTAEETLQLVQARYESGAATVTRYLEAELMSTQAKMRRTNAVFDLERAKAGLIRAIGRFSDVRVEEVTQ